MLCMHLGKTNCSHAKACLDKLAVPAVKKTTSRWPLRNCQKIESFAILRVYKKAIRRAELTSAEPPVSGSAIFY